MHTARFLPAALLILAACVRAATQDPQAILEKSTIANSNLASARFTVDMQYDSMLALTGERTFGEVQMKGAMQSGGRQLDFTLRADGWPAGEGPAWSVDARIIVAGPGETYLRLNDVRMDAGESLPGMPDPAMLTGMWWKLPSPAGEASAELSPDPRYLRMQTDAIDVVSDEGMDTIGGRQMHHYKVQVNKEKLATFLQSTSPQHVDAADYETPAATGDIWIDAKSYVLRRAAWHITSAGEEPVDITITADITDHNSPVTISPPAGSQNLPPDAGLPLLP